MALPDISGLTETELADLARAAANRLAELRNVEQTNRAKLLDRDAVVAELQRLRTQLEQLEQLQAVDDATINADPAFYVKRLGLGLTRTTLNTVRLIRVVGGLLDSTDLGAGASTGTGGAGGAGGGVA